MSRAAAFFDLDRTVLAGGSGPSFSRALRDHGLGPAREPQLVKGLLALFDAVGENRASMVLARAAIRLTSGWDAATFRTAGEAAVPDLVDQVQPFAPELLELHRAAGRRVVLATTSPAQLVSPLAERLGFDDVVATRYEEVDGQLTGRIDGTFVWGRGKLTAVRRWASEHQVDVGASWAYSDSWYDAPLLDAVGTGVATNPDPRLAVLASLRGWSIRHLDKPAGMPKVGPWEIQELLRPLVSNAAFPFADLEVGDPGHLPASGGVILAANHRSYFDIGVVAVAMAQKGRPIRFLGKAEIFDTPVVGDVATALGGIRVDRGSGSEAPLAAALSSLRAGEVVGLMPQGTIPRGEAFFEPTLEGRPGVARLAALSGAPVVPMALWGTEHVWPRSAKAPKPSLSDRPTVTARFGPPVEGLSGTDEKADTEKVMQAIQDLLPAEARERRTPTPEELAATFPPGHSPEVSEDG